MNIQFRDDLFNELIYLTGEYPKYFEDLGVRKKVEKWQFLDKFGRISR